MWNKPAPSVPRPVDDHVNIPSRQIQTATKSIWAIGGGKGGIGKTLIASNLAVYLSWLSKKVVVVDMDLGGANLHTSLGVDPPQRTLSDLVLGRVENIQELVQETSLKNLGIISGAQDPIGIANMPTIQKNRLLRKFREVDADFVLLDLGAGTSLNTLDFFLMADKKIVVTTPEPTSIENAYRFIKSAYYRMLRSATASPNVRQLIEQAMDLKNSRGIRTPRDLLKEIVRISPEDGKDLQSLIAAFSISVILNQVRVSTEGDIGASIQMVCGQYFGIRVDYLGFLPYDNAVWQSIRRRKPFLIEAPNSTAVGHLEAILRNLLRDYQV